MSATLNIDGTILSVPDRVSAGDEASLDEAANLQEIWFTNLSEKLRYIARQKNGMTRAELQAEADILAQSYELPAPRVSNDDIIAVEAANIAREALISQLAAEGLPPPRNLEDHVNMLLEANPEIKKRAEVRVAARLEAQSRVLASIGV